MNNYIDAKILKYYNIYNRLIEKGLKRGLDKTQLNYYTEKHHIVPKCMGGNNDNINLVLLTSREHIIAHKLLSNIFPDNPKISIATYAVLIKNKGRKSKTTYVTTKELAEIRENYAKNIKEISKLQIKKTVSQEIRNKISTALTGKKLKEEVKEKVYSKLHKLQIQTPNGIIYESIVQCSKELKIPETTLKNWIYNHPEKGFKILNSGGRKTKSIEIIGPDGTIYKSMNQCAKSLGISRKTISNWIQKHPELGYKYKE